MSDTATAASPESPRVEVYGVFVDDINQAAASRIVQGITGAIAGGAKAVHIMFQSWGGFVGDGVMLYNFLRAVSVVDVSLYNSGQVSSAAVLAYLGAKRRVVSPRGMFMVHRSHNSPQFATATKLERVAKNLVLDDDRAEGIWRQHITMPDELWTELQYHDLHLTADEAVKFGIATEVGDFGPPPGIAIYRV